MASKSAVYNVEVITGSAAYQVAKNGAKVVIME